jgi:putative PEP-CTERM system TPR-repeat lipoprotein
MRGTRQAVVVGLCVVVSVAFVGCADKAEQKRKAVVSADVYAAAGKLDEAIIEYRRAIQFDPKDGQVRLRLSQTYVKAGAMSDGLREMYRASDLRPDDTDLQIVIGNFLLSYDRFDEAKARADRVLQLQPTNVKAHLLRGRALARLKDLDNAVKDMRQAISDDPSDGIGYVGLGAIQHARGEVQQAEESFRKAVAVDPNSADVRLEYAGFLLASSRQADAERELKQAYAIDANSVSVNRALANFYLAGKRPPEAEFHLKKLADNPKSVSWAGFTLARFYAATRRPDDAVRVLKGLIAREDTALEGKLQLAALIYSRGQQAEAHTLVNEVLGVLPKEPQALTLKAGFLLDEGKLDEAIGAAQAAKQNSKVARPSILLGLAYTRAGRLEDAKKALTDALVKEPQSLAAQVELSRLSLMTGDVVWAQKYGADALRAAPQSHSAREAVVRAALAQGDVETAAPPLAALRRDLPDDPKFLYLEGELRTRQGKRSEARQAYSKALAVEPRSLATAEALIRLDLSEGNIRGARTRADQTMSSLPKNADAVILAARTYATSRDLVRAETLLRQAIDLDPGRTDTYGTLANLYLVQRKLDEALQKFQDAATHDPKSVGPPTMIASVLLQQGRRADAKAAYRQALAIDAEAPVAANNLAFLYAEDGENLDEALRLAEIAKRRLPGSADPLDTLGWVYYKRGMPTFAASQLRDAVAREPRNASFQYHLGLAYARGEDSKKAREALERALSLDPKSPLAAEARSALASLKK